jgi:hypothetical protein
MQKEPFHFSPTGMRLDSADPANATIQVIRLAGLWKTPITVQSTALSLRIGSFPKRSIPPTAIIILVPGTGKGIAFQVHHGGTVQLIATKIWREAKFWITVGDQRIPTG